MNVPKAWMRQDWNDRDVREITKIARSLRGTHPVTEKQAWEAAERQYIQTQAPGHRKAHLFHG
jgi:hypothetical protein